MVFDDPDEGCKSLDKIWVMKKDDYETRLRDAGIEMVKFKGKKTEKSDLHFQEDWTFPTPHGSCPPILVVEYE